MEAMLTTHKRRLLSWILLAFCLCTSIGTVDCSDDAVNDDASNYNYNGGQGNYNKYYANQNDDANSNYNDAYSNYNSNNNNDDANNNNDDGKNYDYEAVDNDDEYDKQFQDDVFNIDLDGFDDVSISPVSCVN